MTAADVGGFNKAYEVSNYALAGTRATRISPTAQVKYSVASLTTHAAAELDGPQHQPCRHSPSLCLLLQLLFQLQRFQRWAQCIAGFLEACVTAAAGEAFLHARRWLQGLQPSAHLHASMAASHSSACKPTGTPHDNAITTLRLVVAHHGKGLAALLNAHNRLDSLVVLLLLLLLQDGFLHKTADWALAVAIPVHMHITTNALVTDYVASRFRGGRSRGCFRQPRQPALQLHHWLQQ